MRLRLQHKTLGEVLLPARQFQGRKKFSLSFRVLLAGLRIKLTLGRLTRENQINYVPSGNPQKHERFQRPSGKMSYLVILDYGEGEGVWHFKGEKGNLQQEWNEWMLVNKCQVLAIQKQGGVEKTSVIKVLLHSSVCTSPISYLSMVIASFLQQVFYLNS